MEMEVLKSGLTLLSNPIGTLICGSGSAKLPNPMDTLIYGGGISQTGFGEFAGPDFSVTAEKAVSPLGVRKV